MLFYESDPTLGRQPEGAMKMKAEDETETISGLLF